MTHETGDAAKRDDQQICIIGPLGFEADLRRFDLVVLGL